MLYCKNISAVAVSPARLAYFNRGEGEGPKKTGGSEAEKEKAKIDPAAAALDVAERGIAADAAEKATAEARAKGSAKFDYAARAIFDSRQEDLGRAVDDVRVTEQLLGKIDLSLVKEENGLKAYERILGFKSGDRELQSPSVFAEMVSLAIRDLQEALKVKPDGRFGGETLGALLRQGTNKQAPDIVRNAYAHLEISPVANPNALLAKIDSGRAGKTARVGLASRSLAATIEEAAETTAALDKMPDQDRAVLLALANYGYHGSGSLPAGGKLLEYSHDGEIGKTVVSETQDGGVSFFVGETDRREYSAEVVAAFMERNSR